MIRVIIIIFHLKNDSIEWVETMNLRVMIEDKYKQAIKAKNTNEVNTLRLIKSAIKDKDIAFRSSGKNSILGDSEILTLLQSLIKQRKDSINSFQSAARDDLIAIEQGEIDVIFQFLPQQMSEYETEVIINKIIQDNDFNTLKDMGNLMNNLKIHYSGNVDMALAGKIAKDKLGN